MSSSLLKILMVASEAAPFAKTGGLADVTGSLPKALLKLGHQIVLVMPKYRCIEQPLEQLHPLQVPMGNRSCSLDYGFIEHDGLHVYFIVSPEHFDRKELYGELGLDYPDNAERFALLSRASLELSRQINFAPDIIHVHDWQTSLVPVFLHAHYRTDPFYAHTASLLTIHNLGYQGVFPLESLIKIGLDKRFSDHDRLEYHNQISLLKGGILFAEQINTVSPTYCQEIQTPDFGMGFDGLLHANADRLHGILNGIDPDLWNPAKDQALPMTYTAANPAGKSVCKRVLQEELGLSLEPSCPLIAMITRLDPQKGIDLVLESWDRLMSKGVQLVILGTGHPDYEQRLIEAASFYPNQAKVFLRFDDRLSRRIYAGSDLFLMPSRYEPCGLGQLIALRYGSIPIVHATGGLADTIKDPQDLASRANGYLFREYQRSKLLETIDRVLDDYRDSVNWSRLRTCGMQQDLSWSRAAKDYVELYHLCKQEAK